MEVENYRIDSLVALARSIESRDVQLPSGRVVQIRALRVQFPAAKPSRLADGVLARTYTSKPLTSLDGRAIFGEIAIVRVLERDGWEAVWVDTFHKRQFWRDMPHEGLPIQLPAAAKAKYDSIVAANGGARGFFDVMAWRDGKFLFLEYKGKGDSANANEARWIESALQTGVAEAALIFVLY
jgi:hypothetical protein